MQINLRSQVLSIFLKPYFLVFRLVVQNYVSMQVTNYTLRSAHSNSVNFIDNQLSEYRETVQHLLPVILFNNKLIDFTIYCIRIFSQIQTNDSVFSAFYMYMISQFVNCHSIESILNNSSNWSSNSKQK